MSSLRVFHPTGHISGTVSLSGSKSISNRVLIIRSLCKNWFPIENLSTSDDSVTLEYLLNNDLKEYDAHHAGTTFRFLAALLAFREGEQILTGSSRMLERPIGPLVSALIQLGANIEYLGQEGYPPIKISSPSTKYNNFIELEANVSSQFISAIMLVAPYIKNGITILLKGDIVSAPYIEMTRNIMEFFGAVVHKKDNKIIVEQGAYQAKPFHVEGDWSSASYLYSIAALSKTSNILINNLSKLSYQGDQKIIQIMSRFGVKTTIFQNYIVISKDTSLPIKDYMENNFLETPDLVQTISVVASILGTTYLFSGLKTLKIKETDRVLALRQELQKLGVSFSELPSKMAKNSSDQYYLQEGKIDPDFVKKNNITIATYNDHRMAMAFAPIGLIAPITIENIEVVSKSFPQFWRVLDNLGFDLKKVDETLSI